MAVLAVIAHFKIRASATNDWLSDVKVLPGWDEIRHIIVIPTYKEPLSTLERTLGTLSNQTFPLKFLSIIISFEEREGEEAKRKAEALKKKYGKLFGNLWFTYHPDIDGEVKGKSSNTSWGAKIAKKLLVDEQHVAIENVTITSEDADALFHPQYFSALTYEFLKSEHRYNRIWQPAIMFYNNIWKVPAPIRVLASVFSVNQMFILMRSDRLVNFSTYSVSLSMIHTIGYWDTDVIPEDYRLFFKAYFALKGKLEVSPIFIPVYADAAESHSYWASLKNQYEQIKRWAWGVSDDAYIIKQWILAENTPFFDKSVRVLKTIEDHFLWPVNWFAVTIGAMLPPLLNQQFNRTILGKTLPQVSSTLLTISLISLLVIFIIDMRSRPPRPNKANILQRLAQPLEFILLPVIGFFFSALPGIDAHTRLMLGKYIEYKVTEKV
jgi:cellulose synthase/poly-beta-1,6-N-acetylglucosamine synthase-like glycosyltransferase